jgi:membrane protein implicated in regulation of membrane protease activity
MLRSAFVIVCTLYSALAMFLLSECAFLAPLRSAIWKSYEMEIICFAVLSFLNLFALVHTVFHRLSLQDTGDKLAHLEKQLRGKATISRELTEKILEKR